MKLEEKRAIAHKRSWWLVWIMCLIMVSLTTFFEYVITRDAAKGSKVETQVIVDEKTGEAVEVRTDKDLVTFFNTNDLMPWYQPKWLYKLIANMFDLDERGWSNRMVRRVIYWGSHDVVFVILLVIGFIIGRRRKKDLMSALSDNTPLPSSLKKTGECNWNPDTIISPRGLVILFVGLVLCFWVLTFGNKNAAEIMWWFFFLALLFESLQYKLKGGKLDFHAVPELFANIGRFLMGIWKKFKKLLPDS